MSKTRPDWRVRFRALTHRRSVLAVIVFRPDGHVDSGSGFVIKRDDQAQQSIVLTSHHFLGIVAAGDFLCVRAMIPGGVQELVANIIHQNASMDVVILRVPGLMSVTPLRFAPGDIFIGQNVIAIGHCNPEDLFDELSFTRIPATSPGCVRPERIVHIKTSQGIKLYHVILDCVSMHGMSGGPVVSSRGVIGMIDSGQHGMTQAVSPMTILQVLRRHLGLQPQGNMTMEQVIDLIT